MPVFTDPALFGQDTPRPTRLRRKIIWPFVGLVALFLLLIGGAHFAAAQSYIEYVRFRANAVTTTGTVLGERRDRTYQIQYQFFEEPSGFSAKPHEAWDSVTWEDYLHHRPGQSIEVLYLASDPTQSHLAAGLYLNGGPAYQTSEINLLGAAMLLLVTGLALYYIVRYRRERRLLAFGEVTRGMLVKADAGRRALWVSYRFIDRNGVEIAGHQSCPKPLPETLIIFYDPANSRFNRLYPPETVELAIKSDRA